MKQSWIIGVFMLYLILAACAIMIEQTNTMSTDVAGAIRSLLKPTVTSVATGGVTGFLSFMTNAGSIIIAFIGAIFLWFPSVWTGYLFWFWFFICLPVSVGFIVGCLIILRGSSAT